MSSEGISVQYLSTGANRQTAAADWSQEGILAFGANSNVALWEPSVGGLLSEKPSRLASEEKEKGD